MSQDDDEPIRYFAYRLDRLTHRRVFHALRDTPMRSQDVEALCGAIEDFALRVEAVCAADGLSRRLQQQLRWLRGARARRRSGRTAAAPRPLSPHRGANDTVH